MEGDDRDRKRPHSPQRDYRGPKTSRPDQDDPRSDDRDRSRDRANRGSGHMGESSSGHRRHDNGYSRDGYQSHGRGSNHNQVVRIARSRTEATSTEEGSQRVADELANNGSSRESFSRDYRRPGEEFSSSEGRRDSYSGDRSRRPVEEYPKTEGRRGIFSRDRSGRQVGEHSSPVGRRESYSGDRPSPNGSSDGRVETSFRGPRSPHVSSDSRGQRSPSGSLGSRERGFSRGRPSPASDSSESRERSISRNRRNPDEVVENVDFVRPNRHLSSDAREGCVVEDRPNSNLSPGGQGGNFTGDQPGTSGSSGSTGRGFSRGRPGFSEQHPSDPRPEGPALHERLQTYAAPINSTVDVNDPSQDRVGRRGMRPPRPSDAQLADFVCTRPAVLTDKTAKASKNVIFKDANLVSNYFIMDSRHKWNLYHYHVDFDPIIERTYEKRALFRPHAQKLPGWHIFDGSALYSAMLLPDKVLELYSARQGSDEKVTLKISKDPKVVHEHDPINIQIYNVIIRSCMQGLGLKQLGRNYYDPNQRHKFDHIRLEIWPGYKTSIRQHENSLLLCVEMINKVIRKETVLEVIRGYGDNREDAKNELLGCIVMTKYNHRTYRIDDINWEETPLSEFSYKGSQTSFKEYLERKYGSNCQVRDNRQPILYSKAKRKDVRRGMTENIALVPELCLMTGLKDEHRKNFRVMQELNKKLQLDPSARVEQVMRFSRLLQDKQVREKVLSPAGLNLGSNLVTLKGHIFKPEVIHFGNGRDSSPNINQYDWGRDIVRNPMDITIPLKKWAVIACQFDANYSTFIRLIVSCGKSMGFLVEERGCIQLTANRSTRTYLSRIDEIMSKEKEKLQMIMCILPSPDETLYGEIKRKCYLDYGIPSQCVLMKNVAPSGKQSGVASKLAIQMNTKLGGVPWKVTWPPKLAMAVGFNISTMGRMRGSNTRQSVGALVATINSEQTKYFSCIVNQDQGQLLSTLLGSKLVQALHAYSHANEGRLPTQIVFYRDGVGDGQLQSVVDTEVDEIKKCYTELYTAKQVEKPQFLFIVVNKRVSTKFFVPQNGNQFTNPLPGTAVDNVVTLPERYDFYLISTKGTGQGTISPTAYNVIHDSSCWKPGQVQLLTHKLCHLYFNWTSTVSVPCVCQYAHKLAFLQNLMNKTGRRGDNSSEPKPQLANTLFYL